MFGLLWSAFSDPFMLIPAVFLGLLTLTFMATVGRRIMRANRILAMLVGMAFVPALVIAIAFGLLWTMPDSPPPNDGPAMLFTALLVLSIWNIPVSLIVSAVYVAQHRSENVR
ncbi:MAG: hypothetical protein V7679_10355 [Parasphingorhabdus sp.]